MLHHNLVTIEMRVSSLLIKGFGEVGVVIGVTFLGSEWGDGYDL